MPRHFKSALLTLLGPVAVPVAGLSAIAAVILLLSLIFSNASKSIEIWVLFIASSVIFYGAWKTLTAIQKLGQSLVQEINHREHLNLNSQNMLGYPSPSFMAFDSKNRVIAICDGASRNYKLHEFSFVTSWSYEWDVGTKMHVGISDITIPGSPQRAPEITHSTHKKGFVLVLRVADENHPFRHFPMQSEAVAQRWIAKLNVIFNG
jgi:hypothetical protein